MYKQKQQNQQSNKKEQSMPINQVAKEIVHNTVGYNQILQIFRDKKHINYEVISFRLQKFSKHISTLLRSNQMNLQESFSILKRIVKCIVINQKINQHRALSITKGFLQYWADKYFKVTYSEIKNNFIQNLDMFPQQLWKNLIQFLNQKGKQNQFEQQLKSDLKDHIKQIQKLNKGSYKIIIIIHILSLYREYTFEYIAKIISNIQYNNIKFIFIKDQNQKDDNGFSKITNGYFGSLLDHYIKQTNKRENAQNAIKDHNLNPQNYPIVIYQQQMKYLGYIYREYKLYYVEMLIKNYKRLIQGLVQILMKNGKQSTALHFIKKYQLTQNDRLKDIILQLRNKFCFQSFKCMINVLQQKDSFGATQLRVLGEPYNYIQLSDFKIYQQNVIFIDQNNFNQSVIQQIMKSSSIGIDCQNCGGKTKYNPPRMSIAQFSTQQKIYIFDVLNLKEYNHFKTFITDFIDAYKGNVVGHSVETDLKNLVSEFNLIKNQSTLKINDTLRLFKEVYPQEKKSSLEYVSQFIFGRKMSKYEQCSAWQMRPLRKAQLHYAALDAFLPLVISKRLKQSYVKIN